MKWSRRSLLRAGLAAGGALVAGGAGVVLLRDDLHRRSRDLYQRITRPPLAPSAPGLLDEATTSHLRAAAEALVGTAGRNERYLAPFHWRSARLPGYRETYRGFARFVGRESRRRTGHAFVELPVADRRGLLVDWFPGGRLRQAVMGWTRPDRMRWRRHVVREILETYSATDAWLDLGYAAWPGMPRGLESFRRRPPGARRNG